MHLPYVSVLYLMCMVYFWSLVGRSWDQLPGRSQIDVMLWHSNVMSLKEIIEVVLEICCKRALFAIALNLLLTAL